MTVKNPLTNQVIVGEVEFYLISKQEVEEKCANASEGKLTLLAYYIGSDYTYAYS